MTSLVIIDYGSGNVRSVRRAFEAAALARGLKLDVALSDDPDRIRLADRIVLPGVGHFADCAAGLAQREGLTQAMHEHVFGAARPFLGICVGMQLMAEVGREDADTPGLGWVEGAVDRLSPSDPDMPVPHMGWNTLSLRRDHPVLAGLPPEPHAYFVHSYALTPRSGEAVAATCDYGGPFTAAIAQGPLFGAQFHPEKSQATGLTLLANFLSWTP